MCWQDISANLSAAIHNRPGLLGTPNFYLFLLILYGTLALAVLLWALYTPRYSTQRRKRILLGSLALLAAVHGFVYSVVNPPWFAPDEPSHFEYARGLASLQRIPSIADISQEAQAPILTSMYESDFWRLNGMTKPDKAPAAFGSGLSGDRKGIPSSFVVEDRFLWYFPQIGNEPALYYLYVWPAFLPQLSHGSAIFQHYWVRWLTVLLYIGCVVLTFLIGTLIFDDIMHGAMGAAILVLFQPMLTYMGSAVNNDVAAAFLASLWFFSAALLFLRGWTWSSRNLASFSDLYSSLDKENGFLSSSPALGRRWTLLLAIHGIFLRRRSRQHSE